MTLTRTYFASTILILTALVIAMILPVLRADALTSSSLLLSDPRTGETSSYTFSTSSITASAINCMQLDIGTASDGSGDVGLDLTGVALGTNTIATGTWVDASVDGTTDQLRATNATGATPSASGSITWTGVVNGANEGVTYYGLFQTFADVDCSTGGPVDSVSVSFIYKNGELVQLTIDPTLTFSCAAVLDGDFVNGEEVTVDSTAAGIDHGTSVTSGENGVSAHDLEVSTNAPGGYTVYIRHTGQLTNGASDTIANYAGGTNASPGAAFTSAGVEGWGYTTEDFTLAGGTGNRFDANNWAGFTTFNDPVMDNLSASAGTETTRVGHQVGIAATTPAGTYQTTIVYTVASTY